MLRQFLKPTRELDKFLTTPLTFSSKYLRNFVGRYSQKISNILLLQVKGIDPTLKFMKVHDSIINRIADIAKAIIATFVLP